MVTRKEKQKFKKMRRIGILFRGYITLNFDTDIKSFGRNGKDFNIQLEDQDCVKPVEEDKA